MLKFYNTLTKKIQDFKAIDQKNKTVKMYSCGPTVYNYAHIGNFRAYVFMDVLRRVLKFNGYKVHTVMNITDVGHLTDDADSGEDKMELSAKQQNKTPEQIASFYTDIFFKDAKALNIDFSTKQQNPDFYVEVVKATDHINNMITFVEGLIENGFAYEVNGNVYFDMTKYNKEYNYGELSGLNLDQQLAGARIEVNNEKRSPYDFALWLKAQKEHIMKWQSPWGMGYPGWHIECTTMSQKYLGKVFDIHTGGIDHVPIHHENEIAQSRGLTGCNQANFWMHCEFLKVDGGKMSKSLQNVYTIDDLRTKNLTDKEKLEFFKLDSIKQKTTEQQKRLEELEKRSYSALDFRYFLLNANFRKSQNFTWEALESAKTARQNLIKLLLKHKNVNINDKSLIDQTLIEDFNTSINYDLNIPDSLGVVWELINDTPFNKQTYLMILKMDEVLGLNLKQEVEKLEEEIQKKQNFTIPSTVKELLEERKTALKNKNWSKSDKLREEINNLGYNVADTIENGVRKQKVTKK